VDRRFVFGDAEREHFRMFMRMQENFTGCRVLSYCVMSNHFHVLLEVLREELQAQAKDRWMTARDNMNDPDMRTASLVLESMANALARTLRRTSNISMTESR
jgi:glucuronate isomerase